MTEPGAYDAQTRGFAVGGSLSARASTETVQPFTFKSPYIKAGCEGIDIFAGAFSWVNADQFVETLKAVGQNAVGYAFNLGLEVVCPVCVSTLKSLMNFMNQINKMSSDSCTAAKALVNGGLAAAFDLSLSSCSSNPNAAWGDRVSGWINCAGGSEADVVSQLKTMWGDVAPWTQNSPPSDATTGVDITRIALEGQDLTDEEKQYALSVIGTINLENVKKSDDSFEPKCVTYKGPLTLTELIHGGNVKLLDCADGSLADGEQCHNYYEKDTTIVGLKDLAKSKLTSIYNKLKGSASGRVLSDDEKTFINRSPSVNVYSAMNSLAQMGSSNEAAATAAIEQYASAIAIDYAWAIVDLYIKKVSTGSHNVNNYCEYKQDIKSILRDVEDQRLSELKKVVAGLETYQIMQQFTDRINQALAFNARRIFSTFSPNS